MVKITIDVDDQTAARLARASEASHVSVEDLLRRHVKEAVEMQTDDRPGRSHRQILSALARPKGDYDSPRDELHDRERDRAVAYKAAREKLLALIDSTQGDLGKQTWNRAALYDR